MSPKRLAAFILATGASLTGATTAQAVPSSYTNGIYTVQVQGYEFGAVTGASHPSGAGLFLTYGGYGARNLIHSYTSNTNLPLSSATPTVSSLPNGVRQTFTFAGADSLVAEQDSVVTGTTVNDSAVRFTLRVKNTGGAPVTIGARTAIDFMIAADDGPVFTPAGGSAVSTAQRYTDPAFRAFSLADHAQTLRAVWTARQTAGQSPDMIDVANCCAGGAAPFIPTLVGTIMNMDNEVRWTWGRDLAHATTIAPGASAEFTIGSTLAAAAAPTNVTPPSIPGTPQEGVPATGDRGVWTASPLASYDHEWQRCDASGAQCSPITGATGIDYTPVAADVGSTLRLKVTVDGVSATSAPSAVVAAVPAPPAPTPTPEPPVATPTPEPPVATPTPTAPVATPTPTATPTGPRFTATVGTTDGGAQTATIAASARNSVDVGCSVSGAYLKACEVELYADNRQGVASAAAQVLIGTGRAVADKSTGKLDVRIELNATGKALLRRSPGGLPIKVAIKGVPTTGEPFTTTKRASLVADDTTVVAARFAIDSPKLSAAAKRALTKLAKQARGAKAVTCTGHTEPSLSGEDYDYTLGKQRARAVCAFLKARGVKASFKTASKGATAPAASNATRAGRALNRRVVVQIVR